jgi:hypothetical protein
LIDRAQWCDSCTYAYFLRRFEKLASAVGSSSWQE